MRKFVALLVLLATTLCSKAQKKDALLYHFTLTDTIGTAYSLNLSKTYRLEVSDPDKDGNRDITYYLEDFRQRSNQMPPVNMTDSSWGNDWNSGLMAPMILWHRPIQLKLYANDSLSTILNEKELKEIIYKNTGLDDYMLTSFFRLPLLNIREDLMLLFPTLQKTKAVGENFTLEGVHYTVKESEQQKLVIQGESNQQDVIKELTYDFRPRNILYSFQSKLLIGTGRSVRNNLQLLQPDVKLAAPDTALYFTALRMSYNSDCLKDKNEMDSLKSVNYLAYYDTKYRSNQFYRFHKRRLLNSSSKLYNRYRDVLRETSVDELVMSTSDVFNGLSGLKSGAKDTLLAIFKAAHIYPKTLDEWIDISFSQLFTVSADNSMRMEMKKEGVSDSEINEMFDKLKVDRKNGLEFLTAAMKTDDDSLRLLIQPLYLYAISKQTTSKEELKKIKETFDKLKAGNLVYGKAAKYKLLFYNELMKNGLEKEGEKLLDGLVEALQKNQVDSGFWNANNDWTERKKANKQLLAHTYYLKYRSTVSTDSKKALEYLAQAAKNSPIHKSESPYEGFYDRYALKSKETYNGALADEAKRIGKPELAIEILTKDISFEPLSLDSLSAQFSVLFPGRSFSEYFKKVLVTQWADAPNFRLSGFDGELYQLKDFRGKWLLLDFWGSWCGPCRQDLPHLEELAKSIKAGKYPNNAFLAISCRESIDASKKFFNDNSYSFPNAVSNGDIESDYKVAGYPTKVLVSPEGKMLLLPFGQDYKKIIELYTNTWFKHDPEPATKVNNLNND